MPIICKSPVEIERMRRAGQLAHEILKKMSAGVAAGVTTLDLDNIARDEMLAAGAVSGSKNYPNYRPGEGFPGYTCISINEVVVHGIPSQRRLQEGDVVTMDVALSLEGYCGDTSATLPVGRVGADVRRLLDVTRQTLDLAVSQVRPGKRWSEIARLMQYNVERNGFSVVREFVGHGIGRSMHEDPKVPNFVTGEQLRGDFVLAPGMTLAVEPMVVMGKRAVRLLEDQWTVITKDRKPAAHFEHTVAVTSSGADILTDGRGPNLSVLTGEPAAAAIAR